jgi:hypothetical protein
MTPAERIRKLIEEALATLRDGDIDDMFRASGRLHVLRECLAIVEEAERARDDA